MNLSSTDYELLLGAVNLLNSDSELETLPARTLNSVIALIPNEILVYDGFGTDNNYSGYLWYSPAGMVWDHLMPVLAELVYQNPVYDDVVNDRSTKIVSVSHYAPLAEFHRTQVYNEFYRHFDADTQLSACLAVSPELYVTCSLHRAKRDFTDREWKLLELFAPHLVSAFRSAQFIQKLTAERNQMETALAAARHGVVTVDLELNAQSKNPTAERLLREYFPPSNRLPETLRDYLNKHWATLVSGDFYLPPAALEIRRKNAKLKIRLAFESESRTIVLLLEETKAPSPADFINLRGLTTREAEVLYWVACGKTNREIGVLCGISPRTAQKHLQNIFDKLGVETRAAATALALESIGVRH
jgi:DNA-binding CsgD family transcriptional regulator